MSTSTSPRFGLVIPVKPPRHAKSRLEVLGEDVRQALAEAFALDTVTAALECQHVGAVLVVTDDHRLAARVRTLGAGAIPDGTAGDLNATLAQGAAELVRRDPTLRPAALCADLPSLRPDELARALAASPTTGLGFVPDAEGVGTTLVTAGDLTAFRPRFGPGSRAVHLETGGVEVDEAGLDSVRRDVDTPGDLRQALSLGLGARTARLADGLFAGRPEPSDG